MKFCKENVLQLKNKFKKREAKDRGEKERYTHLNAKMKKKINSK